MGRTRLSALVGAAFVLPLSAGAWAADLPEIPPAYQPPVEVGGSWYLRGDIGMANQSLGHLDNALFSTAATLENLDAGNFDAVPIFGLGIGYRHNDNLRFDITGEYRGKSNFSALQFYDTDGNLATTGDQGTDEYTAKKSEWLFLVNGYYDIGTWHGVTPYVGAGVGAALNTISGFRDVNTVTNGVAYGATASQWNFAWALHAGLGFQATDNLAIDLGYSFVSLGSAHSGDLVTYNGTNTVDNPMYFKDIYSHDLKLGVRYSFDVPKYYGPAVVKY